MIAELAVAGAFGAVVAAHAAARRPGLVRLGEVSDAPAGATRRVELDATSAVQRATDLAAAGRWEPLITTGWLPPITPPVPDPGNPGQELRLVVDPHGLTASPGGFVLIAANGHPNPDGHRDLHALPVPSLLRDPIAAAAWTYDDPDHPVRCTRATYAALTRRT